MQFCKISAQEIQFGAHCEFFKFSIFFVLFLAHFLNENDLKLTLVGLLETVFPYVPIVTC